jgi:23S rRNA (uracil1939-C5)-methyltransferase
MARAEHLTTTAMASDGRAVARRESGQVVFVEGALPGETVGIDAVSDHGRFASARAAEVISASPLRVTPPCPHRAEGCGGCPWQHVSPEGQRSLKAGMIEEALQRIGKLPDVTVEPTVVLPPWEWRTTITAGVFEGRAALRRSSTHDLVPIDGCLIAHPLLTPLLSEQRYPGVSEILLRCGARTGERLVSSSPRSARLDLPPDVLRRFYHEEVGGRWWRVSADSFFQSRPDGAEALVRLVLAAAATVAEAAGKEGSAIDLYSGVGLFAGVLAETGWTVTAVEGSRSAVADGRANLAGRPVEMIRSDVTKWSPNGADLVIADPSRAGLGAAGVSVVAATGAASVVLISCDVASLGRDAGLLDRNGYQLCTVTPVDMFPSTWRSEVVSVFERRS